MSGQQRDHFRINYPNGARPTITIAGQELTIVDLSEAGVKYALGLTPRPDKGKTVIGVVRFRDGTKIRVEGTVVRSSAEDRTCILHLSKGIPLSKMMEEQRYIIRNFSS